MYQRRVRQNRAERCQLEEIKVVLNADICKKCFDEEVRALRLDDDSDDLDEDEEERKEETKGNENNDNNNNDKTDDVVHDLNKERAKAKKEKRKEIAKLGNEIVPRALRRKPPRGGIARTSKKECICAIDVTIANGRC